MQNFAYYKELGIGECGSRPGRDDGIVSETSDHIKGAACPNSLY